MPWRTLARWGVRRTWRYNSHYADSATLAHAIHKRRMRQRAMRIFGGMDNISVREGVGPLPFNLTNRLTNPYGWRAFPDDWWPPVNGGWIGEMVHTMSGTFRWAGTVWERITGLE